MRQMAHLSLVGCHGELSCRHYDRIAIGDLQLVARFFPPVSLLVCWLAMNVIFACYYINLLPPAER